VNRLKKKYPKGDKVLPFSIYLKWMFVYHFRMGVRFVWQIITFFFKSRFHNDPRRNNAFRDTVKILFEASVFPDLDNSAERILMTRDDVHTVFFGHNHRPTYREFAPGKVYINTGTWNKMTHLEIDRLGTRLACTFGLIEYTGEKPEASLKLWKGYPKLCEEVDVA
jgi:UDP-2,3-diacylglucosamine pyrophosphatase LpxH